MNNVTQTPKDYHVVVVLFSLAALFTSLFSAPPNVFWAIFLFIMHCVSLYSAAAPDYGLYSRLAVLTFVMGASMQLVGTFILEDGFTWFCFDQSGTCNLFLYHLISGIGVGLWCFVAWLLTYLANMSLITQMSRTTLRQKGTGIITIPSGGEISVVVTRVDGSKETLVVTGVSRPVECIEDV